MKDLIQYKYKCNDLFFKFIHDQITIDDLINGLREIENHIKEEDTDPDKGLWFKFFKNDTGATTITEIGSYILFSTERNKEHMMDCIRITVENPDGLEVYFS